MKLIPVKYEYEVSEDMFKHYVGRKPKSKDELQEFADLTYKGMEAQLDWNIIYKCASDNFEIEEGVLR